MLNISQYIAAWPDSPFGHADDAPWKLIEAAPSLIRAAIGELAPEYRIENEVAVHQSAIIEDCVTLKGPIIVGPQCLVAAGAYLRGGVFLAEDCIVGPGSELKTSFMFSRSKIAHLNFVGDSILGSGVNVEAGAIIANYRNELADKTIRILIDGSPVDTGVEKFGALMGDGSRVGANSVIAPGAVLAPGTIVGRLALVDQYPH